MTTIDFYRKFFFYDSKSVHVKIIFMSFEIIKMHIFELPDTAFSNIVDRSDAATVKNLILAMREHYNNRIKETQTAKKNLLDGKINRPLKALRKRKYLNKSYVYFALSVIQLFLLGVSSIRLSSNVIIP